MSNNYGSWGRYFDYDHEVKQMQWSTDDLPLSEGQTVLPYGLGRSYGDSCLNDGNVLIDIAPMNRLLDFNPETGALKAEAGFTLEDVLAFAVPRGWFLAVTPGTKYVTLGGAIANDVHGKNHHWAGNFGHHVLSFELLRSNGERLLCSPEEHSELFYATIGGMGLTGLITWAEIKLKPVKSPYIDMEMIKFRNVDEFFEIAAESKDDYEHTIAWIDCLATGDSLGKGLFTRGNHAEPPFEKVPRSGGSLLTVPIDAPNFALNKLTMQAFNLVYYNQQFKRETKKLVHYNPFFYPLDSVGQWNRIYGKRGFMQYQFIIPFKDDDTAIRVILERIAKSGLGSFLVVFKTFGDIPSRGMMSFPREGINLAMDFPNNGPKTLKLLQELDQIVLESGGMEYAAKDSRMAASTFKQFYPQWQEFAQYVDPNFSSSFWRRVTGEES